MKLLSLLRQGSRTSALRERAEALKSNLSGIARRGRAGTEAALDRRAVVGGALAASVPLPVLAAPVMAAPIQPHPDAELVALGEQWLRARDVQDKATEAWGVAWEQVYTVIKTCPPELFSTREERFQVLGGWRWPTLLGVSLRHVALDWGTPESHTEHAWTGEALRIAIARAVPMLGRGGKTPGRVRCWKAMLPIADAFDARVEAVEAATDCRRLEQARRVAEDEFRALNREIGQHIATTPEGMAALVQVIGLYPWKDTGGAWPNLLRSAANVAGIDPASLNHEYDSINARRT